MSVKGFEEDENLINARSSRKEGDTIAITKLNHIGTARTKGSARLLQSIQYIVNPKKTRGGLLVGGNVGTDANEVYQEMVETKRFFGKTDGRQGYHFIISFEEGAATEEEVYQVLQEFCEEYIGDIYEYIFAVHEDQGHKHGHIVFNSVSREDGYKFRYENGDWERIIQPITDRICAKYDLPVLSYEKDASKNISYKEHKEEREGKPTWTKIIRSDIDFMITQSEDFPDFIRRMEATGYRIRQQKHLTFYAPGAERGRRDTKLGEAYTREAIAQRIAYYRKHREDVHGQTCIVEERLLTAYDKGIYQMMSKHLPGSAFFRMQVFFNVRDYAKSHDPHVLPYWEARKYALEVEHLYEECELLLDEGLETVEDLQKKMEKLEKDLKTVKAEMGRLSYCESEEVGKLREELRAQKNHLNRQKKIVCRLLAGEKAGTEPEIVLDQSRKTLEEMLIQEI